MGEKIFKKEKASRPVAMFFTNLSSACVSIGYLVGTGVYEEVLPFVQKHPALLFDATLLSFSATGGQFAIYSTIANFGSLVLAAIMNVRMLVQVILSMVIYQHRPSQGQVAGLIMVFGTLFLKVRLDQS